MNGTGPLQELLQLRTNNTMLDEICAEVGESSFCYTNTTGKVILFMPDLKAEHPEMAQKLREHAVSFSGAVSHVYDRVTWVALYS